MKRQTKDILNQKIYILPCPAINEEFHNKICTIKRKLRTLTNAYIITSVETNRYEQIHLHIATWVNCLTKESHPEYFL